MSWTDERVETLKKMWSDGQSASQIAKELGGVTRNAVIGKVHRLGLSNRTGTPVKPVGKDKNGIAGDDDFGGDVFEDEDEAADLPETGAVSAASDPVVHASAAPGDSRANAGPTGLHDDAETDESDDDDAEDASADDEAPPTVVSVNIRRQIIPAGQPLPPQPSANEISPEALASVREVEKKAKRLSLMELTERTCKWPIGDPATDDFWFCGLGTQPGKPYCEAHVGVAFQPMSSRRDRRR